MRAHLSPLRIVSRALGALVLPAIVAFLYTQAASCGPTCTGADRYYDGGQRWNEGAALVWESNPADGTYLSFEGASQYHFQHKLGVRPYEWNIDLAFSDHPEVAGNGGSALSAGNLALVLSTTEDEIVIKSDTCASYWIRVVVRAYPGNADASLGDASAETSDASVETSGETNSETSGETGSDTNGSTD